MIKRSHAYQFEPRTRRWTRVMKRMIIEIFGHVFPCVELLSENLRLTWRELTTMIPGGSFDS